MSSEKIGGALSDFWHSSDDHKPASYTAYRDTIYRCGKCGRNIAKGHWPAICPNCGARNEPPE